MRLRRPGLVLAIFWIMLPLAAAFPLAAQSQEQGQFACANGGQDCSVVAPERHVVTTLDYWRQSLARPAGQRIGPASAELLDYITRDNLKNSIPNRPRPPGLSADFLSDVRNALAELPAQVKRLLQRKLAGIYFAEDVGGTGFTEEIVDADSKPAAGFVVLDSALLSGQMANAWASWKENTPFMPQSGFELLAEIEGRSDDNRKNAIQYILLHELGHVLAIGEKIHPPWTMEPKDVQSTADLPYFSLSWTVAKEDNRYAAVFDRDFARRKDVVYYFGAKLPAAQMVDIYSTLETTNFPTLYAASNPADGWAEAFVTYVHTVLMYKPFAIRIYRNGKIAKNYESCWTEKRCAEKKAILERFLEDR